MPSMVTYYSRIKKDKQQLISNLEKGNNKPTQILSRESSDGEEVGRMQLVAGNLETHTSMFSIRAAMVLTKD